MKRKHTPSFGFTLVEMIVSLGVFSVVVTTAVGAILVLISTNQQLQAEQSVMTNLAFALDTMTREMRTGFNYYCDQRANYAAGGPNNIFTAGNDHEGILDDSTNDCANGRSPATHELQGVSFFEGGDSLTGTVTGARRIAYFFDEVNHTIMRRVGNDDPQSIVSSGLVIQNAEFYVTGSATQTSGANTEQPTITIYIEAQEIDDPTAKTYYLQTTVTQRILDL